MFRTIVVTRQGDTVPLGSIRPDPAGGFLANRTEADLSIRGLPRSIGVASTFHSLDRAVVWIEDNPYLPNAVSCPYHTDIFGPTLVQWGAYALKGVAYATLDRPNTGSTRFVVQKTHGQIDALLQEEKGTWTSRANSPNGFIEHKHTCWSTAMPTWHRMVIEQVIPGSMHEKMRMLGDLPHLDDLATRFLKDLPELRRLDAHPAAQGVIDRTVVYRVEDGRALGTFWRDGGMVQALRDGHPPAHQSHRTHASFDGAMAWLRSEQES